MENKIDYAGAIAHIHATTRANIQGHCWEEYERLQSIIKELYDDMASNAKDFNQVTANTKRIYEAINAAKY